MEQNKMTIQRKLAIAVLIIAVLVGIFILISRTSSSDPTSIYTDPNNGDQVAENYPGEPELSQDSNLVITGVSELIDQGVSSVAVDALRPLFVGFKKDITLASIVSKSVTQYRDNPDAGFSYSFEVQIDKGTYYKAIIATTDSTTGKITLYQKDTNKELASQAFGLTLNESGEYNESTDNN